MEDIEINLLIEKEGNTFMASSPEVNVFAEGKTIDEAKDKFISGVNFHLESFPEERKRLMKRGRANELIVQKVFLNKNLP